MFAQHMRIGCILVALVLTASGVHAKPMTQSVKTWEGEFALNPTNIIIDIRGLPKLLMWKYDLKGGSEGTAIGFSDQNGDMLLPPRPNERGVHPIYTQHLVSFTKDNKAEIFIVYSVQGNGAMKVVERYQYDGHTIRLESTTLNSGKRDFQWQNEDEEANRTSEPSVAPAPQVQR